MFAKLFSLNKIYPIQINITKIKKTQTKICELYSIRMRKQICAIKVPQ